MNNSDTEFITEEEITQAASTQDTSLTTPEAKKVKVTKQKESPNARNTNQSK